ncbi:recombinase family protein [Benzoatithermus flavus]|uniref:Recombinase family protein n=1 Tax=Benzoatithermus flavus TaxID=3108223 RepID=A0ABU8XSL9_9PROT
MLIGYARTSTTDQEASFEAQQEELRKAGCEKVYREQVSAVAKERPQLDKALGHLRPGDVLVVTKLDRLARSVEHLIALVRQIEASGASLRILGLGLDTATPTGRLMLTMLGAVAEFERSLMLERQRVGIEKAKGEGKYKGRKPTARAKSAQVMDLKAQGVGPAEIARRLGIGRASVYRILGRRLASGDTRAAQE